jgi:catechol 2,3-dioxygenase-like lactoylglutathione lyase family enzyme
MTGSQRGTHRAMSFAPYIGHSGKPDLQEEREMPETDATTRISKVNTVMVPVSDQDQTVEFFVEKLGFELRSDVAYGEGQRWVEVAPPGGTTTISPVEAGEVEPPGVMTRIAFSSEDVEADHATLRERGVDVDEEILREGDPVPPMFFFRDPDGNHYLLVEY